MNKPITPFNANSKEVLEKVFDVLVLAPVKNLTEQEAIWTLRLIDMERQLTDEKRISRHAVTVWQDDSRLLEASADDKFLALLLDADCRQVLLNSKRCHYCFGHPQYYWLQVAKRCPIIVTKSATLEGEYGGRFLGRGWVIAPHIQTLRKWIINNIK